MQLFLRKYILSVLLFAVVGLAVAFPQPVSGDCFWSGFIGDWLVKLSAAIIFFLQGLSLPTSSLMAGCRPLRLHCFVLFWNFISFPVVTFLLLYPIARFLSSELLLGFGVLAFLPTTIASATAYTTISGGHIANAIVSTVLSNLLAVFVVPVVSIIYFKLGFSVDIPLGKVLLNLIGILVVPLALGQIAQRLLRLNRKGAPKFTKQLSSGFILLILYMAFANNVHTGIFEQLSFRLLAVTLFSVVLLLLVTSVLVWSSAFWIKLEMSRRIAAFYCGSQKSLAAGLPLVSSILLSIPDMKDTGIILIPLLFFHSLQMLLAGIISSQLKPDNYAMES